MKTDHKLDYTNYVTLWKAIILIKICSSISSNEVNIFEKKGFKKIKNLLKRYKFTEFTLDSFSPISFMDSIEFSSNHSLEGEKSINKYQFLKSGWFRQAVPSRFLLSFSPVLYVKAVSEIIQNHLRIHGVCPGEPPSRIVRRIVLVEALVHHALVVIGGCHKL